MAEITNKQHETLSDGLKNVAAGSVKHAADDKFPPKAASEGVLALKTELDASRKAYEDAKNFASIKYDEYFAVQKRVSSEFSSICTSIYGAYGKTNPVVADFGLAPYKPTGKKGPRTKKNA